MTAAPACRDPWYRQVDAAADDHQQLADREDGDHRRLGEHVLDVALRQEVRSQRGHDRDEQQQDQRGAEPHERETELQRAKPQIEPGRGSRARPGPPRSQHAGKLVIRSLYVNACRSVVFAARWTENVSR